MRICFFDLDGTLLTSDKTISPKTVAILKKLHQKHILVGYITARTKRRIRELLGDLPCDFIASYDGAVIDVYKDGQVNTICNECIEDKNAHEIIQHLSALNDVDVFSYFEPYHIMNNKVSSNGICNIQEYNNITKAQFTGCQRIRGRANENISVFGCLPQYDNVYMYFENSDVVFRSKAVTKGTAVKHLLNFYGIEKDDAVCFGDSFPDIDMFTECKFSVAMGNSPSEVKEAATFITCSNDDDGVVAAFNDYLDMRCQDV